MRADRRREPFSDPAENRASSGSAWLDLGVDFRAHPVLERIHLRADLHQLRRQQDGAGRHRQRIRRRRHLPLGLADGGRAGGFAAAGDPLFVLRRILCVGDDGGGEGVNSWISYFG